MTLVDSHAHLDSGRYKNDRQQVIGRAKSAGVELIVTVGADLASSRRAVELAAEHEMVYGVVGIHPHNAKQLDGATLADLRELAQRPKIVAVGEIGLDYYRDLSPRPVQRKAFQAQLAWAAKLDKPVVIHDRDAHREIMDILSDWAKRMTGSSLAGRLGVLHTFSGDQAMAKKAIDLGFYISISGPITYKNANELVDVVQYLPLERILVETDCPFLTPHPHRGKRNEPAYVGLVAHRIAALRGMDPGELAEATTANARRLFRFEN
jgi:TatD DNase family protein